MTRTKFVEDILKLYPDFDTMYGPYTRKDKRKFILLGCRVTHKKRTISWPKAKMEVKLNQRLSDDETVDHKDEDKTNNRDENLQILTRVGNAKKYIFAKFGELPNCKKCGKEMKSRRMIFCSNSCRGKYHGNQYQQKGTWRSG